MRFFLILLCFLLISCGAKKRAKESSIELTAESAETAFSGSFEASLIDLSFDVADPLKPAIIEKTEKGYKFENVLRVNTKESKTKDTISVKELKSTSKQKTEKKKEAESEGVDTKRIYRSLWVILLIIIAIGAIDILGRKPR